MVRGLHEKELEKTIKQVAKMDRNELLRDRTWENKDPQTILVSTWHPKLNAIQSTLKNNFDLIFNDPTLSNFQTEAYFHLPKKKSLPDYLLKNDIVNQQLHSNVAPCGKRKLCSEINTVKLITNYKIKHQGKNKGY